MDPDQKRVYMARRAALMDDAELRRCHTARTNHGDRSRLDTQRQPAA
jgi:hypothetical protein